MSEENKHMVPIELIIKALAGTANSHELAELEQWKSASDENRNEFNAVSKLWNFSGKASSLPNIDVDAEWNKMDKTISPAKVFSIKRVVQIAASLIIILGSMWFFINQSQKIVAKTQMAQTKELALPDGSEINLNANTKITYNKTFGKENRDIQLKGEGYFKVEPDKLLPFIIHANGASVRVVGTEFNVKAYDNEDEVKVSVISGTVELYREGEENTKVILVAGESGMYNREQKTVIKRGQKNINDIAWITREIRFENTTLEEVATVLQNTYQVNFEVTEKVKDCTITVEFTQRKLNDVLKVLKSTLDLRIEIDRKKNLIILDGDGC